MKILITGGSGFIGTNLIEFLHHKDCIILNLDLKPPKVESHQSFWKYFDFCKDDFLSILDEFEPDFFIHLAARTDLNGMTIEDYESNTSGIEKLFAPIAASKTLKLSIFCSTKLVYSNGTDQPADTIYGKSKKIGENLVKQYFENKSAKVIIVRPTSVWGPYSLEPHIPYGKFFKLVSRGLYIHPSTANAQKQMSFVDNACYQIYSLLDNFNNLEQNSVFYLVDYKSYTILEMAKAISRESGRGSPLVVPSSVMRLLALVGDAVGKIGFRRFPINSFRLKNMEKEHVYIEVENMKMVCPDLPFSLEDGVKKTLSWLKSG